MKPDLDLTYQEQNSNFWRVLSHVFEFKQLKCDSQS